MSTIRLILLCIGAGLYAACVPAPDATDDVADRSAVSSADVWWADPPAQDEDSGQSPDEAAGTCCLFDECFENLSQDVCESQGGVFLGPGVNCDYCTLGIDMLTYLKGIDSDRDGLSDLDELENGTDPYDPNDGPDVDGDDVDNPDDPDVDGDSVPNAYDDDIDGDGIVNELDNDRDGDGEPNLADDDDDGDGVKDSKDDDDDADGDDDGDGGADDDDDDDDDKDGDDADGGGDDDDDEGNGDDNDNGGDDDDEPTSQPSQDDEDFLLALARRWFADELRDGDPEPQDLVDAANDVLDEAQADPHQFDGQKLARRFFTRTIDPGLTDEERARREDEAFAWFRKMFDEDGDGLLDPDDSDPNGTGNDDDDADGVPDQQELRDRTDLTDADSDDDGLSDGEEKQLGSDPKSQDSDDDGLSDLQEANLGTDPIDADSDDDGVHDGDDSQPNGD